MKLTPTQKSALLMLANGHRPRQVTIKALIARSLVDGSPCKPVLNDGGRFVAEHGDYPPNHYY